MLQYEGVQFKISSLDYQVLCWKVEIAKISNEDTISLEDSISHVVDTILSILLDKEVPHNLYIYNTGKTILVIPRKFHQSELPFNTCWNDICGLPTLRELDKFNSIKENEVIEILQNNVSISKDDFIELTNMIVEKFGSVYKLEKQA